MRIAARNPSDLTGYRLTYRAVGNTALSGHEASVFAGKPAEVLRAE
jgi:hypothetical protein